MLPFEGLRVVDLSQNVAGPYATMVLADLGAEVIKVEPPQGDPTRTWGPPFWDGHSPSYMALNRNKKAIRLDLKAEEGISSLMKMLQDADVLMVSSRPGAMKRLNLDYDSIHSKFPRIIYAELTAFGEEGPRASEPGYDPLMQAMGGIMSVTGLQGQEPVRVGVSIIDKTTGLWTALGILTALSLREKTGEGHKIGTSLYETAIAWMSIHFAGYWGTGEAPRPWGSGASMIAPYEAFQTVDGWLVIGAGNDRLFQKLSSALGKPEWTSDSRFRTNSDRVKNRRELRGLIQEITKTKKSEEWESHFKKFEIPVAPVKTLDQIDKEPQLHALGIVQSIDHPEIANFRSIGLPLRIDGKRPPLRIPPPD